MKLNGSNCHVIAATRLNYGNDCLAALPRDLHRIGSTRAIVVCGRTMARTAIGLERLRGILGPLYAGCFEATESESPLSTVEQAASAVESCGADVVIALGGGSAMVTARAAVIMLGEGVRLRDLCTRPVDGKMVSPRLTAPKLPIIAVPTTPTTAFAKAGAGVWDKTDNARLTLFDPKTRAVSVFLDPALLAATPSELTRDAALNAFAMGIQAIEARKSDPITDAFADRAMQILLDILPALSAGDPSDELRISAAFAAFMIGRATDVTQGGLTSVLGHSLGLISGVSHGAANAIVLPHTIRFNGQATENRLKAFSSTFARRVPYINTLTPEILATACEVFFAQQNLPKRLRDIGIAQNECPEIAAHASHDFFVSQNPRNPVSERDILGLLEAAW